MIKTVTISEFRENLSDYIDLLKSKKNRVRLIDGRKGKVVVTIGKSKTEEFDWDGYMEFVESIGGKLFTQDDVKAIEESRRKSRKRTKKQNW